MGELFSIQWVKESRSRQAMFVLESFKCQILIYLDEPPTASRPVSLIYSNPRIFANTHSHARTETDRQTDRHRQISNSANSSESILFLYSHRFICLQALEPTGHS